MNETTIEQGRRLLAAGCPFVKVRIDDHHHIRPEPLTLGRLWDLTRRHGIKLEVSNTAWDSEALIELIVQIITAYYEQNR